MSFTPVIEELDLDAPDQYADLQIWLRRNFELIQEVFGLERTFFQATNATVGTGTSPDDETDLAIFDDGLEYVLTEVAGAGMSVTVDFESVVHFNGLAFKAVYNGSTSHSVSVQIWNYDTSVWTEVAILESSSFSNYRYIGIPDTGDYVDTNGDAQVRFFHDTPAVNGHTLTIDFVNIMQLPLYTTG